MCFGGVAVVDGRWHSPIRRLIGPNLVLAVRESIW
jgi:hypothetical protein